MIANWYVFIYNDEGLVTVFMLSTEDDVYYIINELLPGFRADVMPCY